MSIEVRHFRSQPTDTDSTPYGSYSIELYFYKREENGQIVEYRPAQTLAIGILGAGYATENELMQIVMQAAAIQEKQLLSISRDEKDKKRRGPIRPSMGNTFLKPRLNPEDFRGYYEMYEGFEADERARKAHNEGLANTSLETYHENFLPNRVVVTISEDGNLLPEDDINAPLVTDPETGKHRKKQVGVIFDRSKLPQVESKYPIKDVTHQPAANRSSREASKSKQTTQPLSNPPKNSPETVKARKAERKNRKQEQRARARNAKKRA